MKTYSIRLFPTKEQVNQFNELSKLRIDIYNFYLKRNIKIYSTSKKTPTAYDNHKHVTGEKNNHPEWRKLNAKCIQSTLMKLYDNYKSFFALIKKDKSAKPPAFIKNDSFKTLVFNQSGWSVKSKNLIEVNRISVKYKSVYDLKKLNIKEVRLKLINKKWLLDLIISVEIDKPKTKIIENKILAIDLGIEKLATGIDTNGNVVIIHNKPKKISKYFGKRIDCVKSKQSKCKKGSRKFKRLQQRKNRLYTKKNNQIKQRLHIESKKLINMNYNTIVVGDLMIRSLMRKDENKLKKLSKSFGTSNISMFLDFLTYKGESSGTNVVKINERLTTQQNCLTGNLFDKKVELKDRIVAITDTIKIDRDLNSAINIYNRFMDNHLAALTPPLPLAEVLVKNNILYKKTSLRNRRDSSISIGEPTAL